MVHNRMMFLLYKPGADHPYKQHEEYDEDYSAGHTAGNVREFALVSAMTASEGPGTTAGRLPSRVLHAFATVVTEVEAYVWREII